MSNDNFEFYYNSNLNVMCILNKKSGNILTAIAHKIYSNNSNDCWNWQFVISTTCTDHVVTMFMGSTYFNFEINGKIDEFNDLVIEFNGNDGNCNHIITINRNYGYKDDILETYGYLIDTFMGKDITNSNKYMPSEICKAIQECVTEKKTDSFFDLLKSKNK